MQFNGICQCANIINTEDICPYECQQNLPLTYFTSNGTIEIRDPRDNSTLTNLNFKPNVLGTANCAKEDPTDCKITSVQMVDKENGDFGGNYDLPSAIDIPEGEKVNDGEVQQLWKQLHYTGKRTRVSPASYRPGGTSSKLMDDPFEIDNPFETHLDRNQRRRRHRPKKNTDFQWDKGRLL